MSEDAKSVMERARQAQPAWAALGVPERALRLRSLRRALARRMDELLQTISEEVGKPPMDALTGDMLVTLEHLLYYERRAAAILRPRKRGKPWFLYRGTRFEERWEPHGVVLIFAPWNYPLQLSVVPMATALFAGNAVALKCSERTPRTAELVAAVCREAALPEGLVQVSWDPPHRAGSLLDAGPDMVFFTGASANGRLVAQQAGARIVPTVMELGGKDAALVFASCSLERTVNGLLYGSFSNAGQVCVGTKRIYAEHSIYDAFLRRFVERAAALRIGTSLESELGPLCFQDVRRRLREQVEDAIGRGARAHTPLGWDAGETAPIVLTEVPPDARLIVEESFGPVVCVAPFRQEAEAVRMANSTGFHLSASVWTGSSDQGRRVSRQLQSGACAVNDVIRNIGNPAAAFGGNGSSGYGRYHGEEGLKAFSRVKTIMTAQRIHKTEMHWFPFRGETFHRLRGLLLFRHGAGGMASRLRSLFGRTAVLLVLVGGACIARADRMGALRLEIQLPPHARGRIAYLVFAAPAGFPNKVAESLKHGFVPVADRDGARQEIDVGDLPPGRYAVSVYLDQNGDRKLDKSWLGIPREPVGASNNPAGRMGPPRFDDCAFLHGPNPQTVSIQLIQP